MKTITRFPINGKRHKLAIPVGAKILGVYVLEGQAVIFAVVDPAVKPEVRTFVFLAEDVQIEDENNDDIHLGYIGTIMLEGRVLFVFEEVDLGIPKELKDLFSSLGHSVKFREPVEVKEFRRGPSFIEELLKATGPKKKHKLTNTGNNPVTVMVNGKEVIIDPGVTIEYTEK